MADIKFFDLKPGLTLPELKVRSVALMTNGDVRLYYEEKTEESSRGFGWIETVEPAPSPLAQSAQVVQQLSHVERMANEYPSQQRQVERDMASGPGSKKKR